MNRHLYHYTIAGILFTAIAGTLLHFAYEYSMENPLVAMFAPVNESTWEHMKLVFFPSFLYMIAGWPFFMRSYPSYFQAYMTGLFTGTISMVIIFYTYTGIWGNHCLILDILTFPCQRDHYLLSELSACHSKLSSASSALIDLSGRSFHDLFL